MLLSLTGRRLYYDLTGPENGPVVCITHSLASDGGRWAEQVPPLLQAGFRVLRLDMRGHGGSDPVAGDYTMKALAGDVATALEASRDPSRALYRPVDRRHDRPGFRDRSWRQADLGDVVRHPAGEPRGRGGNVGRANEHGAPGELARTARRRHGGALVHRRLQAKNPGRWKQIRDTVAATTPAGYLGCSAAIMNFDFTGAAPVAARPDPGGVRRRRSGHPGEPRTAASPASFPAPAMRRSPGCPPFPQCRAPEHSTGS